jgi:hypothetical protein
MAAKRSSDLPPRVRRSRDPEVIFYIIKDSELVDLERGSPDSILLNFAVFFLSTFASFLAALLSASIPHQRTFLVFVVITTVSGAAGFVLLVLWLFSRRRVSSVVRTIRDRLEPEAGIQEPTQVVRRSTDPPRDRDPGDLG